MPKDFQNASGQKVEDFTISITKTFDGYRGSLCLKPAHEPVGIFKTPNDRTSSDQLYTFTGWDWWHSRREVSERDRQKYKKIGIEIPHGKFYRIGRKALHAGIESDTLIVSESGEEIARFGVKAYRTWYTDSIAANALIHNTGIMDIDGTAWVVAGNGVPQTDIRGGNYNQNRPSDGDVFDQDVESDPGGRWPANIVFQHHPECVPITGEERKISVTKRERDHSWGDYRKLEGRTDIQIGKRLEVNYKDEISYYCHPDCLVHHPSRR